MDAEIRQTILMALQEIPKGKVMTYKSLAEKCGVHPRTVALVMKYNKDPELYPCYKIVRANGEVGGYSAYEGQKTKIEKLEKEGIEVIGGYVPLKYIC